jgi:hypothetical protein
MDTGIDAASNPEARFINSLRIGYTAFEFVLDFGQRHDGLEAAHLRLVTYPVFARAILDAIQESIRSYEQEHGRIPPPNLE